MSTEFLSIILENPNIKKGYLELKKYLLLINKTKESEIIQHLIDKKFNHVNDNSNNQE